MTSHVRRSFFQGLLTSSGSRVDYTRFADSRLLELHVDRKTLTEEARELLDAELLRRHLV